MEKYDYEEHMLEDVRTWFEENESFITEHFKNFEPSDIEDFAEYINDKCWVADSVTGNASGSYTFNAYEAEECLCHNMSLLAEALRDFGGDDEALNKGPEYCDVTIRCYLLSGVVNEFLQSYEFKEYLKANDFNID